MTKKRKLNILKDKRGIQFKLALFALVAVSMCIYGIGVWINDWNTQYDSGLTYDLGEYNKLDELSSYSSSSKGNITAKSSYDTTGAGDFEGTSLRGAFGFINNIFEPFNIILGKGGLIDSIEDRFGIPNYITIGIITLITITIIIALVALFFRKPTSSA